MHILRFQFFCQCGCRRCLTMHKKNFLHRILDVHCIASQKILPGMTRKSADGCDLRVDSVRLTEYLDLLFTVCKTATQRMRGLP